MTCEGIWYLIFHLFQNLDEEWQSNRVEFRIQYVFAFRDPGYLCELAIELISSNDILRILLDVNFFPLWEEFFFPLFIVK